MARMIEYVIEVDEHDRPLGSVEKMEAHRRAVLHRAFSVLILDRGARMLLQRRAAGKYHSAGAWTNACCGHPRPGEDVAAAAARRLGEEMGFVCDLTPIATHRYSVPLDSGLHENELVHVFLGRYDGPVVPDPHEAQDHAWIDLDRLRAGVAADPHAYSAWFREYVGAPWFADLAHLPRSDPGRAAVAPSGDH